MPLYLIDQNGLGRLIYASSPQGAKNHVLKEMRESMVVTTPTPLEVATLVGEQGLTVETATTGITLPPEPSEQVASEPTPIEEFVAKDDDPAPWEDAADSRAPEATSLSGDIPLEFAEYRA